MEENEYTNGGGGLSFLGQNAPRSEKPHALFGMQSTVETPDITTTDSYNKRVTRARAENADMASVGYNEDKFAELMASGRGLSQISDDELDFIRDRYSKSDISKRKAYTNSAADKFLSSAGLPSSKELNTYRQKYIDYMGKGGMEQYSQLLEKRGDNYYMTDTAEWIKNQWAKDNADGLLGETVTSKGKDIKYEDTLLDEQLKAEGFPPASQLNEYYLKYKEDQKAKQDKADRQKRVDAMYDEIMKLEDGGMDRQDAFDTVVQNPKYADIVEKGLVDYEELPSPTDNKYKNDDSSFDEDKTAVIKKNAKYDNMEDRISLQDYERHYAKRVNEKKWAKYAEQQNKVESDFKSALVTPATTTEAKKQQYEAISKYLSNVRVTKDDGSLLTADDYSGYLGLLNAGVPANVIDNAQKQGFSAYEEWNDSANGKDINKWAETKAMLDGLSKDDGVYNNAVSLYRETHAATGLSNYSKDSKYDPSLYDAQISPEMSTSRSTAVSASGAIYNAVNGKGYGNVVGASESQRELLKDFTDKTLSDSSLIDLMSDDEKGTFNLIFKESAKRGLDYLQRLQPVLEQRRDNALFGKVMFASSKENAEDSAYKLNLSASIDEINGIKEGTSSYWKKEAWDRYSNYSDEALQRIIDDANEKLNSAPTQPLTVQMYDEEEANEYHDLIKNVQFVLDTRKQARDDARVTSALYGYKEEDGKKATEEVEKLKAQDLPDELSRFINGKKVIQNDATDINTMASTDAFSAYTATSESRLSTEEQLFINNMTEDQKNQYNWLLLHGEKGDAQRYFDYIRRGIDRKVAESVTAGFKEFGKENPFVASVGSVLAYPIGGMSAVLGSVDRLISGKEISDTDAALWDITGSLREGVQERISDSFENEGFANTLNFLYNVGMSSADSFLGAVVSKATVPFAGELMLSSSAYASTLRAGLSRGLDREKAVQMAVASAAIEFVTEHMGIDNLVSGLENIAEKAAAKGSTSYMTNVLAQMGINFIPEALEEGVGNVFETMADMMINGDASELMEYYDSLIAKGMSKEEANKLMSNKFAKETALEMLAGGLAGAESVGVGGTFNYGKVAAVHGVSAWANPESTRAWTGTHSKDFGKGKAIVDSVFGKEFSDSVQGYIDTKETVLDKRNINEISELLPQMRNTDSLYDYVFDEKGNVKLSNEELVALSAALNSAGADADLDSIEQVYADFMADNGQSARQRLANTNYKYIKTSQELHDARVKLNSLQNDVENAKRDYQGELDKANTALKDSEARLQAVNEKISAIESAIASRVGGDTSKLASQLNSLYASQSALITEVNNHQNALNKVTGEMKRNLDTTVSNCNSQIRDIQRSLDRHWASYSNLLATSTTKRSAYEAQYRFASMRVAEIGRQIDSFISSDSSYFTDSEKYLENMDALQTQLAEAQQEADFWDRKRNKTAPSKLSDAIAAAHSGTVKEFLDFTEPAKTTAPATANTANTAETANTPSNTTEQAKQPSDAVKQENTAQGETAENATEEKKPKQTEEKKEEPKKAVEKKTYTISKTTQEKFSRLAKNHFGLEIVWQTRDEIGGNGRYSSKEPNKVYLATDMIADKGLLKEAVVARAFFTHEVVHYVATTQWYQRLSNLAEAWYRYSGDKEYGGGFGDDYFEFLIQEQIQQEKELHHRDFTREQAREELTAYFVQDVLFEDKNGSESLDWLTKFDGNAVQNFLVAVEYCINRGKARRMKDGSAIKTLLLDAEHALGQAIRERKVLDAAGLSSSFSKEKKNTEQKNTAQPQQTAQNQNNSEKNAGPAQPVAEEPKTEQPAQKTEQFPNYWVAENDWNAVKKETGAFDEYTAIMFVANNMGMEVGKELVNASDANTEDNGVYDKVDDIVSMLSESEVSPAAVATFLNIIYKDGGIDAIKNIPTGEGEANDAIVSAVKQIDSEHGSTQNAVEPTVEQNTEEQPVAEQPVQQEEATQEQPVQEETVAEEPVEETKPAKEETPAEEPVQEEPVAEEVTEEVAEEPAVEEPVAEEQTAEEPATQVVEEQAKAEPAKAYDDSDANSNKKATDKQIVSEATRIFKGTTTDGYGTQLSQGAVKLHDGKQLITDSFQMYVFNNAVDGMPMIDEAEQFVMPIYRFEEIMKKSRDEYEAGEMIRLPNVTRENLLSVSKKFGYSVPTSKNAAYPIYFGKGFPVINGKYMYQALSMFPDAQFFSLKDSPLSPIYVKSKNGDGVIVPLRIEKAKKDSDVRDYLWEHYSNSKNIKETPQLDLDNVYYSAGTTISDLASRFNPNVSGRAATLSGDDIAVPNAEEAIDKSAVLVNENGEPVMNVINNGNGAMFSIGTYEKGGRKAFEKYLNSRLKKKLIDNEQAEKLKSELERVYEFSKKYADSGEYVQFGNWSYMEVKKDPKGKPYLSVITPNNEYKMNLDFSLVCVKRRALDAVINEIVARGEMERIIFDEQAIARINEKIRSMNFETACQMCFVEAARYMQAEYADKFVDRYNKLVNSLGGEADYFNFGGNRTLETRAGIQHMSDSNLDFTEIDRVLDGYMQRKGITSLPKYRANKGLAYADTDEAIAYELKFNPESRRLLLRGDFMSSTGFDSLAMRSPSVLKLWNKKGQGAPKNQFSDMQYLNDIEKKSWDADKAYAVGGVRVQSFSDYVPTMFFDYVQMVADLAAGNLPAHAYTKELNFVKLFGLTGIKINMSLVPAIVDEVDKGVPAGLKYVRDENGNVVTDEKGEPLLTYAWAKESFGFDRKKNELDYDLIKRIQADEKYGKNCGSIAIGVSDEHILRMMADPTIKMIIPYHSSGIPQIVAEMVKTNRFTDYQKDSLQHTRKRVDGKWVALSPKEEFQFNEVLHNNGDPKATVKEYLDWCEKNGYAPKFEKDEKSTKFKNKEGYYKVLEDFTLYDDNGSYVPQDAVQMKFAEDGDLFGNVESILGKSLKDPRMSMISENVDELTDNVLSVLQKNDDNAMYSGGMTIADLDAEYQEALKENNTDWQAQLVNQAAVRNGYTTGAYHGSPIKDIDVFNTRSEETKKQKLQLLFGTHFTQSRDYAKIYSQKAKNSKGTSRMTSKEGKIYDVYLDLGKSLDLRTAKNHEQGSEMYSLYEDLPANIKRKIKDYAFTDNDEKYGVGKSGTRYVSASTIEMALEQMSPKDATDFLVSHGYNSVLYNANYATPMAYGRMTRDPSIIMLDSNRIKSADPITYRKDGSVIPLSERFNRNENSIRYSAGTTINDLSANYIANELQPRRTDYVYNDDDSYEEWKHNNKESLRPVYNDGGSKGLNSEWYKFLLSRSTKDIHRISEEEARAVMYDNVPQNIYDGWFRAYDSDYKPALLRRMLSNPQVRNAGLSLAYENYLDVTEKPLSFEEFLTTPIKLYRGDTGENAISNDVFVAFTFNKKIADSFVSKKSPNLFEIEVRPIDTYGSMRHLGEGEIWIPTELVEQKINEKRNSNDSRYSAGTTISDLSQGYTPRESINDVRKIFNQRDSRSSGVDDARYMALAEQYKNGDTSVESELQDAVKRAASSSMKDSVVRENGVLQIVYHGSLETFNKFDKNKIRAIDYDAPFNGFWFTSDENAAEPAMRSANHVRAFYLNIKNPAPFHVWKAVSKEINDAWFKEHNSSAVRDGARSLNDELRYRLQDMKYDGVHFSGAYNFDEANVKEYNEKGETTFTDASGRKYDLRKSEYGDARLYPHGSWNEIIPYETAEDFFADNNNEYRNADVWVAFEPEQIKSADPVTYRDNGEIIPLSERFDESNSDIRYSNGTTMKDLIASYGKKKQSGLGMLNDVQTAERTSKTTRVSDVAQTVKEAPAQATQEWKDHVDDIVVEVLDENAVPVVKVGKDAGLVYRPMTMEEMNELGDEYITRSGGVDQAMRDLARDIPNATVSDLTRLEAAAMRVIAEVSKTNNFNREDSAEFLAALGILNSNWGRMGKAMQLLNNSPLGRRKYMEKVIERINAENKKKFSKGAERLFHRNGVKEIVIPESKLRDLELATTPEEVRKAEFRISEEIGKQSPLSISDAIRNWRYFAMLANPVTHERNMLGNVGMLGMRMAKDAIAAGLENVAVKTGFMNAEDRTHYVNRAIPKEVSDFAVQLFAENAEQVQGQDRYGVRDKIHDAIKKSPIKLFDTLMRFNGDMLEKEDKIFLRLTYVSSAKQYMMSKGLTNVNDLTAKQKAEIHQYAKQQAQEATYRDASALADTLNALAKKGGAWQFAIESTIPFKKTPINITKRGIEYSPAGLAKGVIDLAKYAINKGKNADGQYRIPASKIADELGKGLVGSALALIGAFLAKAGILKLKAGNGDRDEAYEKDLGHQDYSLEIGNMSIKIESLVPMTFPLFVGAAAMDALSSEEKKAFIPAMSEAMLSIADPIMDMSFMSSLNNTLNSYNQNKLLGIAQNAVSSYASQFAPTVIGRLNSSLYPTRRTTKSSQKAKEGIGTENDYTLRSIASKTPLLNLALEPYVKTTGEYDVKDSFGDYLLAHFDAFLLPVNVQMIDTNPIKNEIVRLVESTGTVDFVPQNPQKYFKDGDTTYNLTAKEYTEYSKDHNETVYAMLKDVINSEEYQNAETDDDKANLLKKAYNKSHEVARKKWKAIIIERHSNN